MTTTSHDPLAPPGVTRILLSEAASRHLTESGEECFAIVSRQSWPADPKRWAIYLLPVSLRTANDATAVLLGKARAARIKTTNTSSIDTASLNKCSPAPSPQ